MVKKVFMTVGTALGAMVVIALIINIVIPNGVNGLVNSVEQAVYTSTGAKIDINGDGSSGGTTTLQDNEDIGTQIDNDNAAVGFE